MRVPAHSTANRNLALCLLGAPALTRQPLVLRSQLGIRVLELLQLGTGADQRIVVRPLLLLELRELAAQRRHLLCMLVVLQCVMHWHLRMSAARGRPARLARAPFSRSRAPAWQCTPPARRGMGFCGKAAHRLLQRLKERLVGRIQLPQLLLKRVVLGPLKLLQLLRFRRELRVCSAQPDIK